VTERNRLLADGYRNSGTLSATVKGGAMITLMTIPGLGCIYSGYRADGEERWVFVSDRGKAFANIAMPWIDNKENKEDREECRRAAAARENAPADSVRAVAVRELPIEVRWYLAAVGVVFHNHIGTDNRPDTDRARLSHRLSSEPGISRAA
jgi:hypothetical protein